MHNEKKIITEKILKNDKKIVDNHYNINNVYKI